MQILGNEGETKRGKKVAERQKRRKTQTSEETAEVGRETDGGIEKLTEGQEKKKRKTYRE